MNAKDRLIVALDVASLDKAKELVDMLSSDVEIFKVGIAPFVDFGERLIDHLRSKEKKIFLDLKFHDIPNTVYNAAKAAAKKGIYMMNFHCLGGAEMLKAGVEGAREAAKGKEQPILLGVTVLTSMDEKGMLSIGLTGEVEKKVIELAKFAEKAGLDGVVASAKEAKHIKAAVRSDFKIVTPGIRPVWARADDQKRVLSPRQAVAEGADYVVVGRPIIEDEDPLSAARRIIEEMEGT